jgi:hypothetical protein
MTTRMMCTIGLGLIRRFNGMNSKYTEWLDHVFNHEFDDWYFELEAPDFNVGADEAADLITATFERSGSDLSKYSDYQVNGGIQYLIDSGASDYWGDSFSQGVALEKKLRLVRSIFHLYRDCFAKRCDSALSHLGEKGSRLNSVCYMFWDICAEWRHGDPHQRQLDAAALQVLEDTLSINHRACREGALHGLGHKVADHPVEVKKIIDEYLRINTLDTLLRSYAERASTGMIQ